MFLLLIGLDSLVEGGTSRRGGYNMLTLKGGGYQDLKLGIKAGILRVDFSVLGGFPLFFQYTLFWLAIFRL